MMGQKYTPCKLDAASKLVEKAIADQSSPPVDGMLDAAADAPFAANEERSSSNGLQHRGSVIPSREKKDMLAIMEKEIEDFRWVAYFKPYQLIYDHLWMERQ